MVEPILKGPKYTEATKSLKPAEERPMQGGEPAKRLPSLDIIRRVISTEGDKAMMKEFMNSLTANMKSGVTRLIQIGNTVFIVNYLDKNGKPMAARAVEFYPMSVEPDELLNRFKVLPNTLKELGFRSATSYTDDPEDIEKIKSSGVPVAISQEMMFVEGEMQPMYRIELRLA